MGKETQREEAGPDREESGDGKRLTGGCGQR